jgi:hypothetical protein
MYGLCCSTAVLHVTPLQRALQHYWPLSRPRLQYKLLHCNNTGHSHIQPCSTSDCTSTLRATLPSNPAVQAAAFQHYWPLSLPTLQYKLLHCDNTDNSQVQPCSRSLIRDFISVLSGGKWRKLLIPQLIVPPGTCQLRSAIARYAVCLYLKF